MKNTYTLHKRAIYTVLTAIICIVPYSVEASTQIDTTITNNYEIYSEYNNGYFGNAVTTGDLNGDGYIDTIYGAFLAGESSYGKVYIDYGDGTTQVTRNIEDEAVVLYASDSVYNRLRFGTAIETADLNGDGYDDLIASAYYDSVTSEDNRQGSIYIFYGGSAEFTDTDIATSSNYVKIMGEEAGGYLGTSQTLTTGDINNDGYADIIIAAAYTDPSDIANAGSTYIIYGSSEQLSNGSVSEHIELEGEAINDFSGFAVTSNDFNGDSYDDIAIGAYRRDAVSDEEGAVYVVYGQADAITSGSLSSYARINGADSSERVGYRLGSGDVNGDGYDDLVIGSTANDDNGSNTGATYIVYGSASEFTTSSVDDYIQITGENISDLFASSIYVDDVNNDGYEDALIGAQGYTTSVDSEGGVYILYGQTDQFTSGVVSAPIITGENEDDYLGAARAAVADVNGDSYTDIIVSSEDVDENGGNSGKAYILYGSETAFTSSSVADAVGITGPSSYYLSHRSAAITADVNGDGIDDLLTSQYNGDYRVSSSGQISIAYGSSDFSFTHSVESAIFGEDSSDRIGYTQNTTSGDFNGDGIDDIVFGTDRNGSNGALYIVYGQTDPFSSYDIADAVKYTGENSGDKLGGDIEVLDINGDGYDDIAVSAERYDAVSDDEGVVYILYGSSSALTGGSIDGAFKITGETTNQYFATAITSADVNGDGYDDLIAGDYNAGETGYGELYILYGKAATHENTVASALSIISGIVEDGDFGQQIQGIDDINGDGYDEILAAIDLSSEGYTDNGGMYIIYGSSSSLSAYDLNNASFIYGEAYAEYFPGTMLSADVNGDEYADIILANDNSGYDDETGDSLGRISIILGQNSELGTAALSEVEDAYIQHADNLYTGGTIGVGDYNNDQNPDIFYTTYDSDITDYVGRILYGGAASITLSGSNPASIACTATYTDAGASATDYYTGSSRSVTSDTSGVDTDTPGSYSVTYAANNLLGAEMVVSRTVNVTDSVDPSISLVGDSTVELIVGDTYTESGVTVSDTCDTGISTSTDVTTSGSVDTDTVGSYTLTYTAEDASGNTSSVTRTVTVSEVPENDVDTGEGDGTGDTEESLGAVQTITRLSNNQVTVEYTEGDSKTFTLFNGSAKAKVKLHTNNDVLIAISKKYIRTYNAYTGERIDQKKLFKSKQKYTKFKRYNVYNASDDNTANSVIVLARTKKKQQKQVKMRHVVVKNDGTMSKKNYVKVVMDQKIKKFKNVSLKRNKKNGKNFRVVLTKKGKKLTDYKFKITKKKKRLKQV